MRRFLSILLFALALVFSVSAIDIDSADDVLALMNEADGFSLDADYTLKCDINLSE